MGIESSEPEYQPPPPPPEPPVEESDNQRRADELNGEPNEAPDKTPDAEPSRVENFERLDDILTRPDVMEDTAKMEKDSQLNDPDRQHVEGAYLIENPETGEVRVERVPSGSADDVTWHPPPQLDGSERLVGLYHTQPDSAAPETAVGPEPVPTNHDRLEAIANGVPGVVRNAHSETIYI